MHIRHARIAATPVTAVVLQPHILTACDHRRNIMRIVGRTCPAAIQHNRIVEHRAAAVFVFVHAREKVRELLTEKQIVFGKIKLPFFVSSVRKVVVRF